MCIIGGTTLDPITIVVGVATLFLGLVLGQFIDTIRGASARQRAEREVAEALKEADRVKKEATVSAKEEVLKKREELEKEIEDTRREFRDTERRLTKREDGLERKLDVIAKKERILDQAERKLAERTGEADKKNRELNEVLDRQREMLHRISGLGLDEARDILLERLAKELEDETGQVIARHEESLREVCDQKARQILSCAIQRWSAEHTAETTVSTVDIPSDDMKGRIIGREGRNIRAFEKATGVDVIVDDTPGVVIVSGFDNVRREIAKLALSKLIQDGRIHPARIEEVVEVTKSEMEEYIVQTGKQAAMDANVQRLHPKEIELLGRLKFRTSYSQNVLQHSLEVCHLAGMLAEELGLDGGLARRCGLLHDIGKAMDHEMEGGHPEIGADLARRFGEPKEVVQAVADHHEDVHPETVYTTLVSAADTVSAARPGARRETLEKYLKRLEELETLCNAFPGVEQSYAIQAGREVRVLVNANKTNDRETAKLCRDIAKSIESQLSYPGEIKVTALRETRIVEYAR